VKNNPQLVDVLANENNWEIIYRYFAGDSDEVKSETVGGAPIYDTCEYENRLCGKGKKWAAVVCVETERLRV